jgi:hypothetical protein
MNDWLRDLPSQPLRLAQLLHKNKVSRTIDLW